MKAYRLDSTPGGMHSLAASTPREAGNDVERALEQGATHVEVEEFDAKTFADLEDAWGASRKIAEWKEQA